jgi:hypothetical protein
VSGAVDILGMAMPLEAALAVATIGAVSFAPALVVILGRR